MEQAMLRPASTAELVDAITQAGVSGTRLRIRGGGSKDGIGSPSEDAAILDMSAFAGIVDYDPSELVLTAGAATSLVELTAAVTEAGQVLAFDPFDHGALFGTQACRTTLGGVIAANVSGPRRLARGAARDHFLGFTAVSGRGERFIAGGKVVKNVTGYDLPKLLAGSWGRLAAMTEITIKVLPRPRVTRLLRIHGLSAEEALAVMSKAMGSSADVSAARHIPQRAGAMLSRCDAARTEIVIDGVGQSVEARLDMLGSLLARDVPSAAMETSSDIIGNQWPGMDHVAELAGPGSLWRLLVRPGKAGQVVRELDGIGSEWSLDWAGGLVWAAAEDGSDMPRRIAQTAGGHAALVRGPLGSAARGPTLQPQPEALALLEERVRRAFDPRSVFETGRF